MGRTCRGICVRYQGQKLPHRLQYIFGHKRCTHCNIFLDTNEIRCPCCKVILRTKPRNRNKIRINLSNQI